MSESLPLLYFCYILAVIYTISITNGQIFISANVMKKNWKRTNGKYMYIVEYEW